MPLWKRKKPDDVPPPPKPEASGKAAPASRADIMDQIFGPPTKSFLEEAARLWDRHLRFGEESQDVLERIGARMRAEEPVTVIVDEYLELHEKADKGTRSNLRDVFATASLAWLFYASRSPIDVALKLFKELYEGSPADLQRGLIRVGFPVLATLNLRYGLELTLSREAAKRYEKDAAVINFCRFLAELQRFTASKSEVRRELIAELRAGVTRPDNLGVSFERWCEDAVNRLADGQYQRHLLYQQALAAIAFGMMVPETSLGKPSALPGELLWQLKVVDERKRAVAMMLPGIVLARIAPVIKAHQNELRAGEAKPDLKDETAQPPVKSPPEPRPVVEVHRDDEDGMSDEEFAASLEEMDVERESSAGSSDPGDALHGTDIPGLLEDDDEPPAEKGSES